ncbi:unnamed protein product [Musa acuminata subsp. burmannicoides]
MEEDKVDLAKAVEKEESRADDEDDDCYVIDPVADCFGKLTLGDPSDDVILVAEKGPVALRDFPHPRHLCANFPFNCTAHESYCSKCFCYVCEVAAPCSRWNGANGHCSVYTKEGPRSEASAKAPRAGIDTKEMQPPRSEYMGRMKLLE